MYIGYALATNEVGPVSSPAHKNYYYEFSRFRVCLLTKRAVTM